MARPSLVHLFDHTIRIWRPTPETAELAIERRHYTHIADVGAVVNRSNTITALASGGVTGVGSFRWYGKPSIDVRRRDVCEVIEGPDAGHSWEVDAEPVRPRGHHKQIDCVEWHGVLPSLEEPS